jgi:hypothetical protein
LQIRECVNVLRHARSVESSPTRLQARDGVME